MKNRQACTFVTGTTFYTSKKSKTMEDNNRNPNQDHARNQETILNRTSRVQSDLPDSPHDAERLKSEETTIDLPDVKDIPGQEFVHVAPLGELADTTISSADEEGDGLFNDAHDDDNDQDELISGTESSSR